MLRRLGVEKGDRDRSGDVISSAGYRIDPLEVENALPTTSTGKIRCRELDDRELAKAGKRP